MNSAAAAENFSLGEPRITACAKAGPVHHLGWWVDAVSWERATVVFLAGNSLWLLYLVPSGMLVDSGRIISRLGIHVLRKEILKGSF